MTVERWDAEGVKRAAQTSGKPLEVDCAMKFLGANTSPELSPRWQVVIGSHYLDATSGKIRELDVLAVKQNSITVDSRQQFDCVLEVYCSCKGFSGDIGPVTYSVAESSVPNLVHPSLLQTLPPRRTEEHGEFEAEVGKKLLTAVGLEREPRIVGMDVFKEAPRSGQRTREYIRLGDQDLFEKGLDSSVKAALYWKSYGYYAGGVNVRVPVLISASKWWDCSIDRSVISAATLKSKGYITTMYPIVGSNVKPGSLLTLMWFADELPTLLRAFDAYFDWICGSAPDLVS